MIKASHIWFNIEELTNIIIYRNANQKGITFVQILIISVTLIVVAVPEGLPLVVTLALAFATKRMTYEKLLVRVLGSCKTMANTSVVCTDKTGTLTQNDMSVVAGSVGIHGKFVQKLKDNQARKIAGEEVAEDSPEPAGSRKHTHDFSIDQTDHTQILSPSYASFLMPPLLSTQPLLKTPILRLARSSLSAIRRGLLYSSSRRT